MNFWAGFWLALSQLAWIGVSLLFRKGGFDLGRNVGDKEGYERGRVDADNWWLGVEQQVDQARQKIWKEEG
jgi:hypothetical protein